MTHEIPAHDVRAGALTLWRLVPWLAPAVVLAVVDPGVATARRAVAIEASPPGGGRLLLVGPDNGLLLPAAQAAGGVARAVELSDPAWHLPAPLRAGKGATFAGRDVFAPAAAHLSCGVDLARLGPAVEPSGLVGQPVERPRRQGDALVATVLWVDRYGNAQLNVTPADLAPLGPALWLRRPGEPSLPVALAGAFAELPLGRPGLVTDSYGLCALCLDRASAAAFVGLGPGDTVSIAATS